MPTEVCRRGHVKYGESASLVTKTVYPDGDTSSDNVQRTYNLDGLPATMTDQRGVVHTYTYNHRRQLEFDSVTDLGDASQNVDGYTRSIKRRYDSRGRLDLIYAYSGTSGGTIRWFNSYIYDDNGGPTNTGKLRTTGPIHGPSISFEYDDSATNGIINDDYRLSSVTYPNGAEAHYLYGGNDSLEHTDNLDDRLSRIDGLEFQASGAGSPTKITEYAHNGVGRTVSTDYVVPDVRREMFGSTTTDYDRWDRFGRPLTNQWEDYGAFTTADRVDYEYDYAGNRTSRFVTASTNDARDQAYSYDGLHRLQSMDQGTESSGSITSKNFEQDFTLDQLGNWENLTETNGTATTLNQNRTFNAANELETIANWSDPNYDAAGNAVSIPDPNAPGNSLTLKYDAWNRLVEVKRGSTVVQTNRYDGLGRRVMRDETGGGGEKRWFFYNEKWQVIEERVSSQNYWNAPADAQYVYHPQYVDAVALRYWDSDATGGADKEHYYLQDSNFNVTAIVENDGTVAERYAYSPYGKVTVLDPNFAVDADGKSDIDNEYLFTGRRLDPVTGLQINRNRFYASHLGRWVNRDPIGYRGGPNLYGYVGAMPTRFVDPLGLAPTPPSDPADPPGEGWEWRGKPPVGGSEGSWYNPDTGESLHPDLSHPLPIGPHWDYKNSEGERFRIYPDGRIEAKCEYPYEFEFEFYEFYFPGTPPEIVDEFFLPLLLEPQPIPSGPIWNNLPDIPWWVPAGIAVGIGIGIGIAYPPAWPAIIPAI